MGKPTGKKKIHEASVKPSDGGNAKHSKRAFDEDTTVFINMSQELKDEGNKLFQKRDFEGAILKYEKAVKLLPKNHIDVANLRSNMAACYMQFGLSEYPKAINECNLALYVSPRYSKALLRRAKCFEELNRLDLAWRDVNVVVRMEPNNLTALEIYERLKKLMEEKGFSYEEKDVVLDDVEANNNALKFGKALKEKAKKKKNKGKGSKAKDKVVVEEKVSAVKDKKVDTKPVEDKQMVSKSVKEETVVSRTVKLVFGEDIRWAQIPLNCSIGLVRDVIRDRFPGLKGVLVKYRDREGDLVTVTTTDELRMVEVSGVSQASLRLYVVEVDPEQEPVYEGMDRQEEVHKVDENLSSVVDGEEENIKNLEKESICVEDWIIQFARLFKNHVGIESDSYLDLHGVGMKLYSEAMEDTVTGEDAQELFDIAAEKFQEMAALAMFNWGNVHMSRARKRSALLEDGSSESVLEHVKSAYEWAQKEYLKAGMRYEEALRIKPDFYEGYLALGHQNFEQAKLCWYYAVGNKVALESGPSSEVLQLYNKAEDSMEKGIQLWEEMEEQRLNGLSKFDKYKDQLQKMGLDGLVKEVAAEEAAEQVAEMRSQVYRLWGILLYERSIVEYKLELPTWDECLEVAIEKFELAGTSPTDIAVMIKNHCSNETALEGFGFKIDEIVQAWNEMYDAERWLTGVPSFRLEPLLRRRVPKLHSIMEHL